MTSHRLTLTALLVVMAYNAFAGYEGRIAPGKVIPEVRSLADSTQRYALYLPSAYDSNESWPVIYAFDPAGQGALAVELFAPAAERFGYIVAGSNNSENGRGSLSLLPRTPCSGIPSSALPSTATGSILPASQEAQGQQQAWPCSTNSSRA